jgi:Ca2+-binding RTX toxin-like protein
MAIPSASGRAVESPLQPAWKMPALPLLTDPRQAEPGIGARDSHDRATARRLAVSRPAGAQAPGAEVARRGRIDGLALGAPVTAAFVGVMLAKGELLAAGAPDAETVAAADRLEGAEGGTVEAGSRDPMAIGPQEQLDLEDGAAEPAAVDPVAAAAPGSGAAQAAGAQLNGATAIPDVAVAAPGGAAIAAGGGAITISLSAMGASPGDSLALEGGMGADQLAPLGAFHDGTSGDDILVGTDQRDTLLGGAGDDLIEGLGGADWLDGGSGDDVVLGGAGGDTLLGDVGDDLLDGGADDDLLLGGEGDDSLLGGAGTDELDGGSGDDSLNGGSGLDRLNGGSGDDILIVDDPNDLALEQSYGPGHGGLDTLQVAEGFSAGPVTFVLGDDLYAAAEGTASQQQRAHVEIENLVLTGSTGHDAIGDGRDNSLIGNAGSNVLIGAAGDDLLQGGGADDLLDGGLGVDRLEGGEGHDILSGGLGADDLYGGSGNDRLAGGLDADRLYGEAGDDVYVLGLNDHAIDTVFDHEGSNHIVLEGVTDQTVEAAIVDGDLYLVVDKNPMAIVSDYVGHEDSFAGVDLGGGVVAIADLLAAGAGAAQDTEPLAAEPEPPVDLLASYLSQPSHVGAASADQLAGADGADWLQGLAGNDQLQGGAGTDVLEGGGGSDLLQGGAGDDRYLFRSGEAGLDTIRDAEGSNIAELDGFAGARLEGVVVGRDLIVVADYAPIFKVENYVGNEASFAGVQVDDTMVPTEELFG